MSLHYTNKNQLNCIELVSEMMVTTVKGVLLMLKAMLTNENCCLPC